MIASISSMNSREGATLYTTAMSRVQIHRLSTRVERTYLCLVERFAQRLFRLARHTRHNRRSRNRNKRHAQFLLKIPPFFLICIPREKNEGGRRGPTPPIAFASIVLPQPGGPCSNTPRGGCTPVCRYTSGCARGIATSSSIFSTHGSTPPKSARRTAGGACSFAPPTRLRLVVLPSSPRVERSFRLLDGAVVVEGASSAFPEEGGTGSGRGGSSEGGEVGTGGGVAALVDGALLLHSGLLFFLARLLAWTC